MKSPYSHILFIPSGLLPHGSPPKSYLQFLIPYLNHMYTVTYTASNRPTRRSL